MNIILKIKQYKSKRGEDSDYNRPNSFGQFNRKLFHHLPNQDIPSQVMVSSHTTLLLTLLVIWL